MNTALQLAFSALTTAIDLFNHLRAAARQSDQLTPEQDAAFDNRIAERMAMDHWKMDPK